MLMVIFVINDLCIVILRLRHCTVEKWEVAYPHRYICMNVRENFEIQGLTL